MFCVGDEVCDIEVVKVEGILFGVVGWGFMYLYVLCEYEFEEMFVMVGEVVVCIVGWCVS